MKRLRGLVYLAAGIAVAGLAINGDVGALYGFFAGAITGGCVITGVLELGS